MDGNYRAVQKFVINSSLKAVAYKTAKEIAGGKKYRAKRSRPVVPALTKPAKRAEIAAVIIHAPGIFRRRASHNLDYRAGPGG